jgi:hypothetical protein
MYIKYVSITNITRLSPCFHSFHVYITRKKSEFIYFSMVAYTNTTTINTPLLTNNYFMPSFKMNIPQNLRKKISKRSFFRNIC